jgi:hypothetical protein
VVTAPAYLDLPRCEALASRAAAGDAAARDELVFEHLWPTWLGLVRGSRFLGPLRRCDDEVENIRAKLAGKVKKTLPSYPAWRARNPDKTLADWNRIAVANVVRRYVRGRFGDPLGALAESDPSIEALLNEFTVAPILEQLGTRPPITLAQTAAEMLQFARAYLDAVPYRVLEFWLEGGDFEEIAAELRLESADLARRHQRAAVAILRREFRGPEGHEKKRSGA